MILARRLGLVQLLGLSPPEQQIADFFVQFIPGGIRRAAGKQPDRLQPHEQLAPVVSRRKQRLQALRREPRRQRKPPRLRHLEFFAPEHHFQQIRLVAHLVGPLAGFAHRQAGRQRRTVRERAHCQPLRQLRLQHRPHHVEPQWVAAVRHPMHSVRQPMPLLGVDVHRWMARQQRWQPVTGDHLDAQAGQRHLPCLLLAQRRREAPPGNHHCPAMTRQHGDHRPQKPLQRLGGLAHGGGHGAVLLCQSHVQLALDHRGLRQRVLEGVQQQHRPAPTFIGQPAQQGLFRLGLQRGLGVLRLLLLGRKQHPRQHLRHLPQPARTAFLLGIKVVPQRVPEQLLERADRVLVLLQPLDEGPDLAEGQLLQMVQPGAVLADRLEYRLAVGGHLRVVELQVRSLLLDTDLLEAGQQRRLANAGRAFDQPEGAFWLLASVGDQLLEGADLFLAPEQRLVPRRL